MRSWRRVDKPVLSSASTAAVLVLFHPQWPLLSLPSRSLFNRLIVSLPGQPPLSNYSSDSSRYARAVCAEQYQKRHDGAKAERKRVCVMFLDHKIEGDVMGIPWAIIGVFHSCCASLAVLPSPENMLLVCLLCMYIHENLTKNRLCPQRAIAETYIKYTHDCPGHFHHAK